MSRAGTLLVVSPHLDDAALSAGALIAERAGSGTKVHVLTLFTGFPVNNILSPVARDFHDQCGLPHNSAAFQIRRDEDLEAMAVLGAHAHHTDFQDAIYRRRPDGTWLCTHGRAMFDTALPDEPKLRTEIEMAIEFFCRLLQPDCLVTCAGIGHHIDHLLTRDATLSAANRAKLPVELWEDLPYALDSTTNPNLPEDRIMCTPTTQSWACIWATIERYRSQNRMLWAPETDWLGLLTDHAAARGAGKPSEVFWRRSKDE